MIVVAIISLIAVIVTPNLLRSQIQANEANALANIRTIALSNENYQAETGSFATQASTLTSGDIPFLQSGHNLCGSSSRDIRFLVFFQLLIIQ